MTRLQLERFKVIVLEPVDMEIGAGRCVGIRGASGAGKTMFLRAVADLDPHQGKALLDGVECSRIEPPLWRRQVAYLASESAWWFDKVGPHLDSVPGQWLRMLGFGTDVMEWSINRLSSGERQRLALLRMLANRPKVLLLDEPSANLDTASTEAVENFLTEYRKRTNATLIWVSHDLDQLQRVCDLIFTINSARLVEEVPGK